MEYIISNWPIIIAGLSILALVIINIIDFFKQPTSEQLKSVREWLLYMVVLAERELGSGTGKLKLRFVYDKFLEKFPYLASILSFQKFSDLVDDALDEMKELLSKSKQIAAYANNDNQEVSNESE